MVQYQLVMHLISLNASIFMEYAIIQNGGKQYRVHPGLVLEVDNLNLTEGAFSFDDVLLHVAGDKVEIGAPYIAGFAVQAKILGAKKGEKIHVSKFKAKSKYRRSIGFRASLTSVEIVSLGASKPSKKADAKE